MASLASDIQPLGTWTRVPAVRWLLAVLCGVLSAVSCTRPGLGPLSFVALVPLVVALRGLGGRQAVAVGLLCGCVCHIANGYWVAGAVARFTKQPLPVAIGAASLVWLFQSGRFVLLAWLSARGSRNGWPPAVAFLAAFATAEIVYPMILPWYFSMAAYGAPVLMQVADLGGPVLVSTVLVAVNLALAEPIAARLDARRIRWMDLAGLAAWPVAAVLYGLFRITAVDAQIAASPPVRVGIVQSNLATDAVDPQELLRQERMTAELRQAGAELVLWSEAAIRVPLPERRHAEFLYERLSRRLGIPALVGATLFRSNGRVQLRFNSLLATDASGRVTGRYDKRLLIPFAEYMPLAPLLGLFPGSLSTQDTTAPGQAEAPLVVVTDRPHRVTALICYEAVFPRFARERVAVERPELLVNAANDAWFGNTVEPWGHLHLAMFRAVEHHRYLVRPTNSGLSAVIDPAGRILRQGGLFRAETLLAEVRFIDGAHRTVYERLGDLPWLLAVLGSLAMAIHRRLAHRSSG